MHTKPWGKYTPGLAQGREGPLSQSKHNKIIVPATVDTSNGGDTTAKLKQQTIAMAAKVMIDGERNVFFGDSIDMRRGTKEVEAVVMNQEYLRHGD